MNRTKQVSHAQLGSLQHGPINTPTSFGFVKIEASVVQEWKRIGFDRDIILEDISPQPEPIMSEGSRRPIGSSPSSPEWIFVSFCNPGPSHESTQN